MSNQLTRVEAVAEALASADGKLEEFRSALADDASGHRDGYLAEAESLILSLNVRGFDIVPLDR